MRPVIYYGNLLLSGTLSGTAEDTSNVARKVRDGSINLPYTVTADVLTIQSGSITLELTSPAAPDAFVLPKCALLSGHTVLLQSMDDLAETNLATLVTLNLTSATEFILEELTTPTPRAVWRLLISGAQSLDAQARVHEWQLALEKLTLPRSPQVGVGRERVRQFTRLPVPGGQPFVKRDGPRLRRTTYDLVVLSGTEVDSMRDFADAVDGGQAFTLTDDLGSSYWAELSAENFAEDDQAGASRVRLQFQEIRTES